MEQFEAALLSLRGYFGVIGVFGGNPALHPQFADLCALVRKHVPYDQRGLWCNHPITLDNAMAMRATFNPAVSNLNVHLDRRAYKLFKQGWPECHPFGLDRDSRHAPVFVAMKDVLKKPCGWQSEPYGFEHCDEGTVVHERDSSNERPCTKCNGTGRVYDEEKAWELISSCDINQHWSALIGVFRGQLRAWFCEIAGAQAMLHQDDPEYPDTGLDPLVEYEHRTQPGSRIEVTLGKWWQLPMTAFTAQVRKHCQDCGVPLRGYGELSQAADGEACEQTSWTHQGVYLPKRLTRTVEVVTHLEQLGVGRLKKVTDYIGNGGK